MHWQQRSLAFRVYLLAVYVIAIPMSVVCLTARNDFSLQWFFLAASSVFLATINVRLPKLPAVISMGDVFIILILMQFGPGPALATYWIDIVAAHTANLFRKYGFRL